MTYPFNPRGGLIVVETFVEGPTSKAVLRLALDTGATNTLVNTAMLVAVGYDPALSSDRTQVTTGSGIEFVPRISLSKVAALGLERQNLSVLVHTLPPSSGVDGLLGLDFFANKVLKINFRLGHLELE
jgi:predicted aspartyl protease